MIKAVLFDMGGVILNIEIEKSISAFKERAGFDTIEDYLNTFHQKGFIGEMEAGLIGPDKFIEECLKRCRPGTTAETIFECFGAFLTGLNEDIVAFIKELHSQYDLYLLSNNNPLSSKVFCDMMAEAGVPVDTFFKKHFFSFEMKMVKPSPEIYRKTIEGIGLAPEEILFIDDSTTNIAAAQDEGIRTILYKNGMDIREAFRQALA
ncbi:MAG: HAD family phosphatase [Bacteroidales bacterium]|nr:HAD family phosphatase [Bacteroidales bacterium]